MELLTSDMMTRALTLVSRGQNDRAQHLLQETRSILKGLGKGGLPPLPSPSVINNNSSPEKGPGMKHTHHPTSSSPLTNAQNAHGAHSSYSNGPSPNASTSDLPLRNPHHTAVMNATNIPPPPSPPPSAMSLPPPPTAQLPLSPAPGIDFATMVALDAELALALEWIAHPAVFARDARKAVLQAIGVASSQRAYTFRTGLEGVWAGRVLGVRAMCESSGAWGEALEHGGLVEE